MDQRTSEDELDLMINTIKNKSMKKWFKDYAANPSKIKKQIKSDFDSLNATIDTYRLDYVDGGKNAKAAKRLLDYEKAYKEMEGQIKEFMIKNNSEEDKPKGLKERKKQGTKQEVISIGDKYQDDMLKRLGGIQKDANNAQLMTVDANVELERQEEQMLKAAENVLDMKSSLKRAQEYLAYFSKEFYQDKFVRIMTLLILLTFVTIVIIAFFKKKSTATTTTTSTTNTTATTNTTTSIAFLMT
jgi:hypothetical protein